MAKTKNAAKALKTAPKKKVAAKKQTNYLTKRILTKAARLGFSKAAAETMQRMGYNVVAYRGWVVKKFADGRIEKLERLPKTNSGKAIVLD